MKKLLPFLFLAMTSICRADSKTPRLGLILPTIGSPTWGQKINGNFQILDATAIAGSIGLLAVGTGTANNFTTTITSITYGISFRGDQFSVVTDTNNRTAYVASLSTGGGGGGSGTITTINGGTGITVTNSTGPVVTITATGGGGTVATADGLIVTSSANVTQTGITSTPVLLNVFNTNGHSNNTTVNAAAGTITVSTTATYFVGMNIISTGTGNYNFYCRIRVNGSDVSPSISCQDTPSVRCVAFGQVSLSSGDVVSVYANTSSAASSTITVTDAQLAVHTIGGPGAIGPTGPQGPAGSGGGGASVNVSPHSVLFSTGGTTISGNTGMQYDDSVSSITLKGRLGIFVNFANFLFDSSSNDPYFYIDDENGSPGGGIKFQYLGADKARFRNTGSDWRIEISSANGSDPNGRIIFPENSERIQFQDDQGNNKLDFDPLGNSSFTIPVVLRTILGASSLATDSNGLIIPGSASGGSISTITAGVNIIVANSTGPNVAVSLSSTIAGPITFSSTTIGTFYDELFPSGNGKLPGSNSPFISNSTGELNAAIYFDDTSTQTFSWTSRVHNYDGRPLYIDILFHSTATTNFVCFGAYTSTMTPNVYNVSQDVPVFSVVVTTAIALSGVSLSPKMSTVQLTNTTVSNGDKMTLKLERETGGCGNTEAVGFARVDEVFLRE